MLDQEDLKWIASTTTELNSLVQQISRYTDLARQHRGEHNYLQLLAERVEIASKTTQGLFDRVTSSILTGAAARPAAARAQAKPSFSVLPPPEATPKPAPAPTAPALQTVAMTPAAAVRPRPGKPALPSDIAVRNPSGPRELILLVEDEAEIADLAAQMLADEGYRIILANNGVEALKIYKQIGTQIGLVILDFFLPVLDGDAVFEELQMLNPDVNVVLSSGFAEQTKLGAMLARGLRGFIPKPYTTEKLLSQVSMTLEAARQAIA